MLNESAAKVLNNYFDKIILLTIKRNTYRIPKIEQTFNGLNFELFFGIDGNELDIEQLKHIGQIDANINEIYKQNNIDYMNLEVGPLLKNQIAVALSHKQIYQYIKDTNTGKTLILEDDTIPVVKNLQYLAETLNEVPKDCEILFLGHIYNNDFSLFGRLKYYHLVNILYTIGFKTKSIIRKKKSYPRDFSRFLKKHGGHIGTHAYALYGNGASKLLAIQTPLTHGASDLLTMDAIAMNKIQAYTCKYMFFEQNQQLPSSVYNN